VRRGTLAPPTLEEIRAAARRIHAVAIRTPLIPLGVDGPCRIWLKLENLQPIGSFKVRGAGNAILSTPRESLARGVFTASAGNMAQGIGYCARRLGVAAAAVVPDHAPRTKLEALERLSLRVVKVPFDEWWRVITTHDTTGIEGLSEDGGHPGHFIHPVADPRVIAGNGTIGLEILEDLPGVDTVVVPYGGGGLVSGIASALRSQKPEVKVLACEVETAAPLGASLAAGEPVTVDYIPSFVDGIGGKSVLLEMWPLVRELVFGSVTVTLREVAEAIRLLLTRARVLAEGAGAAPVAAALAGRAGSGDVVCVVSGGNLDLEKLAGILAGTLL
jgi:threonine dehydratase